MILPHTMGAVWALIVLSVLCWGAWANTYKLGKWRFELYYLDFAFGAMAAALFCALTFGSLGFDGFTFTDDLLNAGKHQWLYAFAAGVVFNFANMLLLGAVSVAGLAVAFPLGLGLALIVGTVIHWLIAPAGNLLVTLAGMVLVVASMVFAVLAHRGRALLEHEQLAKAGKAKSTRRTVPMKGVVLALVAGLLMGTFYPLIAQAQESEIGLGPYAAAVLFAAGLFFSTFVFNLFFMNLPVAGEPLELLDYFKGKAVQHLLGLAGGVVWFSGAVASFVASSTRADAHVSASLSYPVGQVAALVAVVCGLAVWKEFQGSDARVKSMLAVMMVLFASGLALVSLAPGLAR